MSVQEICRVVENTQLGDGLFLMVLHAPKITELAQCGQFVHIACGEGSSAAPPDLDLCMEGARAAHRLSGEGRGHEVAQRERKAGDELDVLGPARPRL